MNVHDKYLTVSALTNYIKETMERDPHLQEVWIKGEISNFRLHHRGHMYFSLKDDDAKIDCSMFKNYNVRLKFKPEDGMNVLIKGYVSVYPRFGNYQLYVQTMEPDGVGALFVAYEQLKKKLEQAGYFLAEHKRPIPSFPSHVALITSPTSAAVRDMITTIKRRFPIVQITIIPATVQGEDGVPSIVRAINRANAIKGFDTIIVARGGGSIEDLWCFNDERVVQAIFNSSIPIVTGIGHETDSTLSDFVADLRAPTPTAAAELVVPNIIDLMEKVHHLETRLIQSVRALVHDKREWHAALTKRLRYFHPEKQLAEKEQMLDHITESLHRLLTLQLERKANTLHQLQTKLALLSPEKKINDAKERLERIDKRSDEIVAHIVREKRNSLHRLLDKLTILNPLQTIKRGYAVLYDKDEQIIRSVNDVEIGDSIDVKIADGIVTSEVKNVIKTKDEKRT